MRTRLIKLAAAVAVVVAVIATSVSSASAATGSLTVTTLGRDGAKVASSVSVVNLANQATYTVASGSALSLPTGSYALLVDILDSSDATDTVGASLISLAAGKRTVTIDARNGHALSVGLDSGPNSDYVHDYEASVCVGNDSLGSIQAYNSAGNLYVIPNSSTRLRFGYLSSWVGPGDPYVVSGETTGLPGALGATYRLASLATWHATVRRGPAATSSDDLALQPAGNDFCRLGLYGLLTGGMPAPYVVNAHISAGSWALRSTEDVSGVGIIGDWNRERTLAAGTSYSQTFYSAPWGPAHELPYVRNRQVWFSSMSLFNDPSAIGSECCAAATVTLSFGSKVLSTQHITDWGGNAVGFKASISSTGWYTLNVSTTRSRPNVTYPSDMLSKSNTVNFRFWGNPKTDGILPVYLTRFAPSGLDLNNAAAGGSRTKVTLVPNRETNDPVVVPLRSVPVTKVQAWWSNDDGKTWHSVPVTHSGSTWSTVITNPASGYVSLRSTITNNSGVTTTTIPRAYAVA